MAIQLQLQFQIVQMCNLCLTKRRLDLLLLQATFELILHKDLLKLNLNFFSWKSASDAKTAGEKIIKIPTFQINFAWVTETVKAAYNSKE